MLDPACVNSIQHKDALDVLFEAVKCGPKKLWDKPRPIGEPRVDVVFVRGFTQAAKREVVDEDVQRMCHVKLNVRAEAGPTAKRQARVVENALARCAGLAF